MKLFSGADESCAVLGKHGKLEKSESNHEDDDHQLQHHKVSSPELPTVFVVSYQEREENEANSKSSQHEIGDGIVEEVNPQTQQHYHQW